MLKNYFKIAWRSLQRNKVSVSLNIAGLAIGMGVALLIGLWVWDELSFDSYPTHERLAQVMVSQTLPAKHLHTKPSPCRWGMHCAPVRPAILNKQKL